MQMYDLYIQTNDLVAGNLNTRVNEALLALCGKHAAISYRMSVIVSETTIVFEKSAYTSHSFI